MKTFRLFEENEPAEASPSERTSLTQASNKNGIDSKKWAEHERKQAEKLEVQRIKEKLSRKILAGAEPYALFLDAVECIAVLSGDRPFIDKVAAQMDIIHGDLTLEPLPPEFELPEVRARMDSLKKFDLKNVSADVSQWVIQAMNLHREREIYLQKKINDGK